MMGGKKTIMKIHVYQLYMQIIHALVFYLPSQLTAQSARLSWDGCYRRSIVDHDGRPEVPSGLRGGKQQPFRRRGRGSSPGGVGEHPRAGGGGGAGGQIRRVTRPEVRRTRRLVYIALVVFVGISCFSPRKCFLVIVDTLSTHER